MTQITIDTVSNKVTLMGALKLRLLAAPVGFVVDRIIMHSKL